MQLYGDYILQGRVIDTSDGDDGNFVVVEIEGVDAPVVVACAHILGTL